MWTIIPSLDSRVARSRRRLHRAQLSDPYPDRPRLAHVHRRTDRVYCLPDHRGQHRRGTGRASPLRSLLQLLQPQCLDRRVAGESGLCPGRRPPLPRGRLVSGGGRHVASQARHHGLRTGLVPRRRRLNGQAGRHRLGEQLGGPRPGDPHPPGTRPDPLPTVTGTAAPAEQGRTELRDSGQGDVRRDPRSVPGQPLGADRRRGLRFAEVAGRPGPAHRPLSAACVATRRSTTRSRPRPSQASVAPRPRRGRNCPSPAKRRGRPIQG